MKMQSKHLYIVIIALVVIILFQRNGCTYIPKETPKVTIDTLISVIEVHDTIPGKPILIKAKKDTLWRDSLIFQADTNYANLLKQYITLGDSMFSKNVYKTSYELDSFGTATVVDTVTANKLAGRLISYNLNIPTKTITITQPASPKRQIYIGGGLAGNNTNLVGSVYLGALYKDRQDRIFGAQVGFNNEIFYGISSYWKIKLR
jgi:hypothetical protein